MAGPASPKQVRQMVRNAINAALSSSGWRESRHPYDMLTPSYLPDGREIEHRGYAVGMLSSRFTSEMRQRNQTSTLATSIVGVRWAYRLRADSPPTNGDYDAALDAQQDLVAAVRGMIETQGQQGRITTASQMVGPDGLASFGELAIEIIHHYPLT